MIGPDGRPRDALGCRATPSRRRACRRVWRARRWLGYPDTAGGLLTTGGSAASVEALVAAREAAGHPERPTVYTSDQSHGALKRVALIAGAA